MPFAAIAFFALGIERILYGYCFICTNHFKTSVDESKIPGLSKVEKDGNKCNYWRCMQRLGMYIKVFQVSVCSYDLLVLDYENVKSNLFMKGMLTNPDKYAQLAAGILLIFAGQTLNYAVFKALGAKGVYYGYEFGYHVGEFYAVVFLDMRCIFLCLKVSFLMLHNTARVSCFPYNLNISDPQYWGVVMCIFGIYLTVGASNYLVPLYELFWYMMSMYVFENERGRRWAAAIYSKRKLN
jgi:hypothetical protein